jgi:hypothetical protein
MQKVFAVSSHKTRNKNIPNIWKLGIELGKTQNRT